MSSSSKEEEEEKPQKSSTSEINPGNLDSKVNNIIDALSQNVGSGTTANPNDHEYEYEEYEIEEYEEEEEEQNSSKLPTNSTNKSTFMTQNISTMQPDSPKAPKPQSSPNKNTKSPNRQTNIKTPIKSPPKSSSKPTPITPKPIEDPATTANQLELLIRDGTIPDNDSAESVLRLINRRKVDALLSSDYESAEVYDKASQNLLINLNNNNQDTNHTETTENQTRHQQLLDKLHDTESRYTQQLQSNNEECERRLTEIEGKHLKEIELFKSNWKNPDYIKQFSKPSSTMLQLRYVEKKLALAKRYNDAVFQRKLGDKQQLFETESLQKSIEKVMTSDYQKLRAKQKSEIEKIEQHFDRINSEIESKMNREKEMINQALKRNVEIKPKNLNKLSFNSSHKLIESNFPSPRTKKKFNKYKSDRSAQIILTPFDDATLSKLPVSSLRSDRHKLKSLNNSRSSTALSTARSTPFASSRSKSSVQKNKTGKSFSANLNSRSNFPNLNS